MLGLSCVTVNRARFTNRVTVLCFQVSFPALHISSSYTSNNKFTMSISFLYVKVMMANIFQLLSKVWLQNPDSAGKNVCCIRLLLSSMGLGWGSDDFNVRDLPFLASNPVVSVKMQIMLGRYYTFSLSEPFLLKCELSYYMGCKLKHLPRRQVIQNGEEGRMGTLMDWRVHGPFRRSPYIALVDGCHIIFARPKTR